jgi:hypothetical protein
MFALMLVCVTSDLVCVPSAWSKRFHLYTETTTCCVGVYREIVGLYVIDIYIYVLIPRLLQQEQLINSTI